ncbi:hypothetical protein JSE7799_03283 [Jannaschia seosinensis]|uniref:DUF1153 domain-containing protein n=1 Tax=Jannaschia seosinensis TaxID=313367 RepID=A0A0M7BED1_9RHOB|nr:DUF1153 domain-containing protein [Jannaschia seosinensis]CUH40549.1 hypothetical protein JSE7799_03283 [Jannaschia seosinensis]
MFIRKEPGPRVVTLPNGDQMTRADLPPPGTTRWVARRKEAVVRGVQSGLIDREEALERYDLSDEEFEGWERAMVSHGTNGLKTTLLQKYRQS